MKKLIYFIEFIFVYTFLIFFRLLGYKISSNLGFIIGKFCGPIFRSKRSIIENIKKLAKQKKLKIITTEKDYLRLNKKNRKNVKFLKIDLSIKNMQNFSKFLIERL